MRSLLFLVIGSCGLAQDIGPSEHLPEPTPTVSFSPQGAQVLEALTGRRIPGVGIYDLVICSPTLAPISAGVVYQLAASKGISFIAPKRAGELFYATVAKNWRSRALEFGIDASLVAPILGTAGVIAMAPRWIAGLLSGHLLFGSVERQLASRQPNPTPLLQSLLEPESIINFGGGCKEAAMISRYNPKWVVSGTFPLMP